MTALRRTVELSPAQDCGPTPVLLYSSVMTPAALLGPDDPPPVEIINSEGKADALLICDHASAAIPVSLGDLGLDQGQRRLHIAWDIGVAEVTRRLCRRLDAPGVLSGYSRLVVDCNRQLEDPSSIAQESDDIAVPGNRGLDKEARRLRAEACFWPYQRAIAERIAAMSRQGRLPMLFSLHSFTPVMQGFERRQHLCAGGIHQSAGNVAGPRNKSPVAPAAAKTLAQRRVVAIVLEDRQHRCVAGAQIVLRARNAVIPVVPGVASDLRRIGEEPLKVLSHARQILVIARREQEQASQRGADRATFALGIKKVLPEFGVGRIERCRVLDNPFRFLAV